MGMIIVNLVLTIGFGFYPLIHLREYLAFMNMGSNIGKDLFLEGTGAGRLAQSQYGRRSVSQCTDGYEQKSI